MLGIVFDDRGACLHCASDDATPRRDALPDQAGGHRRTDRHFEDQVIGLFIHEEQASRFTVQNGDRILEDVVEQGFGFEGGGQLPRDLVQRG